MFSVSRFAPLDRCSVRVMPLKRYNIKGDAMSFNKVSGVAKLFKVKLAQSAKGDPLDFEGAQRELGAITDVKDYNKPKAPVAPTPKPSAQLAAAVPGTSTDMGGLPSDLKQMLDTGAPGLKGVLHLTINGDRVSVAYNADRWNKGAGALKKVLMNALSPKYMIDDPVGYFNPSWTFNY